MMDDLDVFYSSRTKEESGANDLVNTFTLF